MHTNLIYFNFIKSTNECLPLKWRFLFAKQICLALLTNKPCLPAQHYGINIFMRPIQIAIKTEL